MTYLNFDGNAAEVMTFYHSVLGGNLNIQKIGDNPMKENFPPEMHDKVMHASVTAQNILIGASDMSDEAVNRGNAMRLCLDCESEEEMQKLWKALGEGGKVNHAINNTPWGAFGDMTDKFGITWMLNYTKPGMGADMNEKKSI